jgi:hypothetical protein
VISYDVVVGDSLYNSENAAPVKRLSRALKQELDYIVNRTMAVLGGAEAVALIRLNNVYLRSLGITGKEYILDMELVGREGGRVDKERGVMKKRASIFIPHLNNLVQIEIKDNPPVECTVEFVIPLSGVNDRLYVFLNMYEELCLKMQDQCNLNLVVYGDRDCKVIGKRLDHLRGMYPNVGLRLITGHGKFSRGRALELGMATLSPNDLVFVCDVDMALSSDFLQRCRRNTVQGQSAYYPQFFKYYNMQYVYHFSRMPWGKSISRHHGHWATYSYGMLCIYKSDYDTTGGYNFKIEGWGGEDVDFALRVLRSDVEIMRAPDPALSHRYHDKVCSTDLTPRQFAQCISSRSEDLADRTRLAEHIFYLEEKCKIKKWKLWG